MSTEIIFSSRAIIENLLDFMRNSPCFLRNACVNEDLYQGSIKRIDNLNIYCWHLAHYQTTNFRLFQPERVCRRQFQI